MFVQYNFLISNIIPKNNINLKLTIYEKNLLKSDSTCSSIYKFN